MIPAVMVSPDKTGLHARSKIRLASCPRSGNTMVSTAGSTVADGGVASLAQAVVVI